MQTLFRLAYAIVVALLLILFVILGIRTVYPEPESPWANGYAGPVFPSAQEINAYESRQVRYERNVLVAATLLAAVAVVGGLYVFRHVGPLGLGLALGGLGVASYGWAQAGERFDQIGPTAPSLRRAWACRRWPRADGCSSGRRRPCPTKPQAPVGGELAVSPRASATISMSLSPRPDMQTRMRASGGSVLASSAA